MVITDAKLIEQISYRRIKWGKELVSGTFIQGVTYLKKNKAAGPSEYCCLGVACEIFGHLANVVEYNYQPGTYRDTISVFEDVKTGEKRETYLPIAMKKYLGLSRNSERLLASLNDKGVSFEIIKSILLYLPIEDDYVDFGE